MEALALSLGDAWPRIESVLVSVAILLASLFIGYLMGRIGQALLWLRAGDRPRSGRILAGKAFVIVGTLIGLGMGLRLAYQADLLGFIAALGIVSLGLGFGLQNTVANLAAGVSLSLDKPFEVGDRIQVGQTWGDVVSIGLRSTRIRTTAGQQVIVPNAVLDTREVWNSTFGDSASIRIEVPFQISYESSIPLAEMLSLKAARALPQVLAYPPPVVRVRSFADSGILLELRCWINRAQDRAAVADHLLRDIKHAFDEGGVQFPYPHLTIMKGEDQPEPAQTPEHMTAASARRPLILACVRTNEGARQFAPTAAEFAKRVTGSLLVLHVRPPYLAADRVEAEMTVNTYMEAAEEMGVPVRGRLEVGSLGEVVAAVAKEEGAQLVLFGRDSDEGFAFFGRHEVQNAKRMSPVPFLAMEAEQLLRPEVVDHWKTRLGTAGDEKSP
jgi:small-conductance mechanosensitive channel